MEEKFTWVETHKGIVELFLKTRRNKQNELIQLLKDVGINVNDNITHLDPFTFFCYIYKHGDDNRLKYLQQVVNNINQRFELNISYPNNTNGLPSVNATSVHLFDKEDDVNNLWIFFEKINSQGEINDDFFTNILNIRNIGKAKLTQVMFYVNPEKYLPIDAQTIPYLILENEIDDLEFATYAEYLRVLEGVKSKMSNEKFCKISADAYNWNKENGKNYVYWFVKSNEEKINLSNFESEWKKIATGQIVLSKTGQIGRITAFAINPYNITIEWIKKEQTNLKHQKQKELKVFDLSDLKEVLMIKEINRLIGINNANKSSQNKINMSSLNQILYGPPGTGKTYNTINRALEIIGIQDRKKDDFDEYIENGQIVFTTFHQSMNYEDFIEGIKPETNDENVTYKVKNGIFKKIVIDAAFDFVDKEKYNIENLTEEEKLEAIKGIIWKEIDEDKIKNARPYVIIIDEINRGNVSAIFGELITLIEDSKRLGKDEALTVTLPYSKEPFGVPPNLYIIGTMNTADRSVEALDTALRRRFIFEEMMPDLSLLNNKILKFDDGKELILSDLLKIINERIEVLLSRDHLIGHSYFLEVDSSWGKLNETFYKNIIPLLQEYFYGDYGKIGLVLGSGFVEKTESKSDIFGDFTNDYDGYTEKTIFKIKPNNQDFNIQTAITELLKNGKKQS